MKKIISLFLLVQSFVGIVSAQNWDFGISLNPQITSVHWGKNNNYFGPGYDIGQFPLMGFHTGLEISRRINDRFSFLSGLQIGLLRYGNHSKGQATIPPYSDMTIKGGLWVFCLPVGIRFETKKAFYFSIGAQVSPSIYTSGRTRLDEDGSLYSKYGHFYNRFIYKPRLPF